MKLPHFGTSSSLLIICLRGGLSSFSFIRTELDWILNLRIVWEQEKKEYFLEKPIPQEPSDHAPRAEKDAYKKHVGWCTRCNMPHVTMNSELQKQF